MRSDSTIAIVLRTRDYGESDKIVTLLSRDAGKFGGIAKGAKRSQRRFAGALEIFSYVTVDYRYRQGADLAFLERAVIFRPWRRILDSLERYSAASHVVELADKMTVEREVGDELFLLVVATLARIDAAEPARTTLRLFELGALAACGYRAELSRCRLCHRSLVDSPGVVRISPGGVSCRACSGRDEGGVLVSEAAMAELVSMQEAIEATLGGAAKRRAADRAAIYACEAAIEAHLTGPLSRELASAVDLLLRPHLRARLRTLELLGPILEDPLTG